MVPGLSDVKICTVAEQAFGACKEMGMDEFNYADFDSEGDMLDLWDRNVTVSNIYLLAEFALETLRNKK